ncbi:similar to Saccharomyces cerevisiae YDR268W MSW1 Mitochondrial tryptophanyl-tRNA synthetase [Maudiozyma saulgeensis]|uniref:tryptophan--tRNA ligase n=1 Tax=Maudiozyma saulgeensis TaxID=1789683 RepID=A0A1X7R9H7_9SACH|nr:similar to Saccharomyces cerevisiae YDR268W MSW1 Mitochondrial tryptophanyl-tRNA synthetase [Kazachstania saulgeensis]
MFTKGIRSGATTKSVLLRTIRRWNHMESCVELPMDKTTPLPIPDDAVIFSMIQPTGIIHLGNYLGAINTWKQINDKKRPNQKIIYGIADLHALTIPKKDYTLELKKNRMEAIATLLSCGIDPHVSTINFQSMVGGYHTELFWYLSCLAPLGYLNRMTQWKDKKNGDQTKERLGLFAYPVLQAADIMIYKGTHVPVGDDQSQHLELTRYLSERFNAMYNVDYFPSAKTLYSKSKKIANLSNPNKKMSKSSEDRLSMIYVTDSPESIREKIKKAKTDSISDHFYYDPVGRPGVSNLLEMVSGFQQRTMQEVEQDVSQFHDYRSLKDYVSDIIIESLAPIRSNYSKYTNDKAYLESVIQQGYESSQEIAHRNLTEIKKIIGLSNDF